MAGGAPILASACLLGVGILARLGSARFVGDVYTIPSTLPAPQAFYPLTEGMGRNVSAYPGNNMTGGFWSASNTDWSSWWVEDSVFGTSLWCNKSINTSVVLPPSAFANGGPFSINIWFKPDVAAMTGPFFEYIYSQSAYGLNNTNTAYASNTINIYLPDDQHPDFSLIRTIVKDASDNNDTEFLDSDGQTDVNALPDYSAAKNVTDGDWHMVTVTSQPGGRGYYLYVDGVLAGTDPADGGGPFDMTGNIVLCSRDSLALEDRFYQGSLSHLSLFSSVLSADQIMSLYTSVMGGGLAPSPGLSTSLMESAWLNQFSNDTKLQVANGSVELCYTNATAFQYCSSGYTCAALNSGQLAELGDGFSGQSIGVCATPAAIKATSVNISAPLAYFPMTNYSLASWPLPDLSLTNASSSENVSWVADPLFGTVINCSGNSAVEFTPPAWGTSGAWAMNIWVQQRENAGDVFQYVISARDSSNGAITTETSIYDPNDVHVYLPESRHPAHGLVRAIVEDNTDSLASAADENYLDSDGWIGSNDNRTSPRLNFTDGAWHMITVTTMPSAAAGFEIFVDGMYMAALANPQPFFHVSGGNGMSINGPIVLCGRSDLLNARYFDGKIAQMSLFDTALTNETIGELYGQVLSNISATTLAASAVGREAAQLLQNYSASNSSNASQAIAVSPGQSGTAGTSDAASNTSALFTSPTGSYGILPEETTSVRPGTSGTQETTLSGQTKNHGGSNLSSGAIAGIVIGTLAGVAILTLLLVVAAKKLGKRRRMNGVSRLQEVSLPDVMPDASLHLSNGTVLQDLNTTSPAPKGSPKPQTLELTASCVTDKDDSLI